MRTESTNRLLLTITSCTLVFAACHDTPSQPTDTPPFQARINSQPFVADITDFSISNAGSRLVITGVRTTPGGGGRQVSVQLENWNGPGTYQLGDPAGGALGFILDRDATQMVGSWLTTSQATGQLTVSSVDQTGRRVVGTFSFEARDSLGNALTVSEGSFAGHYFVDP